MKFYYEKALDLDGKATFFISKGIMLGKYLLHPLTIYHEMDSLHKVKERLAEENNITIDEIELQNIK